MGEGVFPFWQSIFFLRSWFYQPLGKQQLYRFETGNVLEMGNQSSVWLWLRSSWTAKTCKESTVPQVKTLRKHGKTDKWRFFSAEEQLKSFFNWDHVKVKLVKQWRYIQSILRKWVSLVATKAFLCHPYQGAPLSEWLSEFKSCEPQPGTSFKVQQKLHPASVMMINFWAKSQSWKLRNIRVPDL